jgi:dolichol-phosphate mannosyltransferase
LEVDIFPHIKNHTMSILVADDNSPDGTANVVRDLMGRWENIAITTGEKHGLGAVYIRAMTYAIEKMGADVVFEMDADGQHDAKKIPQFIDKIDLGYEMVIGTRYSDGGSVPSNWPIQRKIVSVLANLFVRTVFWKFDIHDWTGGYRALRKEVFLKEKKELGEYKGYIFQISFLHKTIRDGFKVAEVPFHFSDRELGRSKIAPIGYIFDVVKFVLIARFKELKRFIKFLIVGGTGFLVQLIFQEFSARVLHFHDSAAVGVGAEAAIISNFLINHSWTFRDTRYLKENAGFFKKLLKFNMASFGSIIIQVAAITIFVLMLGKQVTFFGYTIETRIIALFPTIVFLVIPLNYLIYNKVIWKTQHLKEKKKAHASSS